MAQKEITNTVVPSDVEVESGADEHLRNTTVHSLIWQGVTVTVNDRNTKESKNIVDNVDGLVEAGQVLAIMGPSGCGKTTLLNVLANRETGAKDVSSTVLVNGQKLSMADFRDISCFVEQDDALIGSLTVRETLYFASRLSTNTSTISSKERKHRIDGLLRSFGLQEQAHTLIGTPIRKGISGGQKRRVGVASQLITSPKILFLDEPTSGLDSVASLEVISYLKDVAKRNNLIVIASIHQPSTSTFNLFDKLLLLSKGRTQYFGEVQTVMDHYAKCGHSVPLHTNPAEFLLDLVNTDFADNQSAAQKKLVDLQEQWERSSLFVDGQVAIKEATSKEFQGSNPAELNIVHTKKPSIVSLTTTLLHRAFIKSYRDVVAYGIRIAMYFGLAVMMGTVWLRLGTDQSTIVPMTNAIFFGGAFMSFMAVAYVPAFLEDRQQYVKEHYNGLYGPTTFMISNFLIGVPYLFIISVLFSVIAYWLSNSHPTASAFFTYILWLFLDLLAAESLVVLLSSLFPIFVVALALVAFANGLWMCVDGFMVPPAILNVFYKYVFSYWDYQRWVFEGMMVNEFNGRVYSCAQLEDGGCNCMYPSSLMDQCLIDGQGYLDQYGYQPGYLGRNVGIMIGIIAGYRLAGWVVLLIKKK